MNRNQDPNNPDIAVVCRHHGYRLERSETLPSIDAVFYELTHEPTGARHIHVSTRDRENTFSVAFKTVPTDSTGVAHILEHTALCGSRGFPVKDPFFSMLKRSLSTFMNAFTASDWTMYPFSTQNRKDYYNLMDVYLDAAFFPNLEDLSFKQEGHRLEIEPPGETLAYKGVVYNEMKGAMSSPDQVLGRSLLNALYPDTTYSHNSGGDPAVIPQLTHAQLVAFHRRHYHPSNAFFYTYGNLPLDGHLAAIGEKVLRHFTRIDPGTDVAPQTRWTQARTMSYAYPLERNEDPVKKSQVCIAWLTADIKDSFEILVLKLLEQVLLGNAASPLRKALIDSELGSALSDASGFDPDNRDTLFTCGLKDVDPATAPAIERIVTQTLERLAADGIDRKLIDSALHQIEFHHKEITNTPYPYGIKLLLAFSGSWFHGGDPVAVLNFEQNLDRLNDELARGPFFENRIRSYFLDNPHRVRLTLAPDQQMGQRERERVAAELARRFEDLTPAARERLRSEADALKQRQERTEDVGCLPTLELEDIPPEVVCIAPANTPGAERAAHYHQATSGIFYFASAFGVGRLGERLLPLVPFFCYALPKSGTADRDFVDLAQQIDLYTGGIGVSPHAHASFSQDGACTPFVAVNGKALKRNRPHLFELLTEILGRFAFTDLSRLKSLLLEYRAAMEAAIVHNGHRLAISLAARNFSTAAALNETWSGIHQIKTLKQLTADLNTAALESLAHDLVAIGRTLFVPGNHRLAVIAEKEAHAEAGSELDRLAAQLATAGTGRAGGDGFTFGPLPLGDQLPHEGWTTATAVSFVAQAFPTVTIRHPDAPALAVLAKMLRSLYLHREIREKGGAYGGFALYNPESGLFSFGSYRDPHIRTTLAVYDAAGDFITSGRVSPQDVKEAVLQVCSEIDKPDPPGPAARKAFYRTIIGLEDAVRREFKGRLLALNRDQVTAAAARYFGSPASERAVAVISNADKIAAANSAGQGPPLACFNI